MDDLIDLLQSLMKQAESLADELSEEEMKQIFQIFQDASEIISENQAQDQSVEAPISDNVQLLWQLSGGQPNAFASYLREFPDPSLQSLLSNPSLLASTIERLQQNHPVDISGSIDGIPHAPLNSSNIYGFKFNPSSKKLRVRFHGGSEYEYSDIPNVIFNLFSHGNATATTNGKNKFGSWFKGKNPSLGAALNQYIKKGGFSYKRLR